MTGFTFLHAADLHLDSPLRGLDPDAPQERLRGATRQALVRLVDTAIDRRVAFVLLAGDLYDSRNYDWHTGQFLVQQLGRLLREGIEVVAIAGNHDPLEAIARKLGVPGMLGAAKPETRLLRRVPVAVHGQSYAQAATITDLSDHYPDRTEDRFNIGLLHTACGRGGHENYAPCTVPGLARRGYDYWALGHVHTREIVSRDPWVVFPGNLQGRHINEDGDRGATLVTVAGGRVQSAEHLPLDVLRWRRLAVNATGAAAVDDVLNRVRLALDEAVLLAEDRFLVARVTLTGETAAHGELGRQPRALLEQVRGVAAEIAGPEALFVEDLRLATAPALDLAAMRAQPGPIGALVAALELAPSPDPAIAAFAAEMLKAAPDLLDADHPAHALAQGVVPDDLAARARALVLAELARR